MIFIGSVSIQNVSGGNVQFGNIVNMSPTSASKSTSGAGSENEGMLILTTSGFSLSTSIPTAATSSTTSSATSPVTSTTPPNLIISAALNPAVPSQSA
ncbi:spore germination protein [Robertmurraya andreesenii]|uniref:Spore germination protein n=1 Tax=Anoxybacillus andreesenii TaxID=1325932 RepID=A0ABT9V0Q0_9BACL|nr:spore germination protein [Robertmurraya andreesenii]MDQ0154528.1 hypothetical protein [Robertmurraya andreesenii]